MNKSEIREKMKAERASYHRTAENLKTDSDLTPIAKRRKNMEAHAEHSKKMKALRQELRQAKEAEIRKVEERAFKLPNASHADQLAFDQAVTRLSTEKPETLQRMLSDGVTETSGKAIAKAAYKKGSIETLQAVGNRFPSMQKSVERLADQLESMVGGDKETIDWDVHTAMKATVDR